MTTTSQESSTSLAITIGSVVATSVSYHLNSSVLWAIAHFFCGWLYVVYALFVHSNVLTRIFGR